MNIALCIGNGSSRNNIKLEDIQTLGPTYGCNQLIETFALDNTIVVDKLLLIDLLSKGFSAKTNLYTRQRWKNIVDDANLKFLDEPIDNPTTKWDNEIHWGSGTHALNLAAKNGAQLIVMIGYDLYDEGIYSNKKIDPACWIHQIKKCFDIHSKVEFVQIQTKKWQCPTEWNSSNFSIDNFQSLLKMTNINI